MQWLLTAVVLVAACWMVAALTIESDRSFGEILRPRLQALGHWVSSSARAGGRASARALSNGAGAIGGASVGFSRSVRNGFVALRAARADRRDRRRVARRQSVAFDKSALITGPERPAPVVSGTLPILNMTPNPTPAFSRLLAFLQLVFLVVLWGGGAALAIAGAAWAVTRIV